MNTHPLRFRPRAFIDAETTGLEDDVDELISLAIIIEDATTRSVILSREWLFKPTRPELLDRIGEPTVPGARSARAVNGYDEARWAGAPAFASAAEEVAGLLEGCVWVGQNPAFDRGFIRSELRRAGRPELADRLPRATVDLAALSYHYLAPLGLRSLSLDAVREWFRVTVPRPHAALGDARDTRFLYHEITRRAWEWRARALFAGAVRAVRSVFRRARP